MFKDIFVLLFTLLFFVNCNNNEQTPSEIINEDSMAIIVAEMHLADAVLITPSVQSKPKKINTTNFYMLVLKKHNLTKEMFEENIKYYGLDTAKMKKIYDEAIKYLNIKQSTLEFNVSRPKK